MIKHPFFFQFIVQNYLFSSSLETKCLLFLCTFNNNNNNNISKRANFTNFFLDFNFCFPKKYFKRNN